MAGRKISTSPFKVLGATAATLIVRTLEKFTAKPNGGGGDCGYWSVAQAIERSGLFPEKTGHDLMMQLRAWTADYIFDHFQVLNKDYAFIDHRLDRKPSDRKTVDGKVEVDIFVRQRFLDAEQARTEIRKPKGDWLDDVTLIALQRQLLSHNIPLYILLVTVPLNAGEFERGVQRPKDNLKPHDIARYATEAPPSNTSKVIVLYRKALHYELLQYMGDQVVFDAFFIESLLRNISSTMPTPLRVGLFCSGDVSVEYHHAVSVMNHVMRNFSPSRCKWVVFKSALSESDTKFIEEHQHRLEQCDLEQCFRGHSLLPGVTFHMILVNGAFLEATSKFETVVECLYHSLKDQGLFIQKHHDNGEAVWRKYFRQPVLIAEHFDVRFKRDEVKKEPLL